MASNIANSDLCDAEEDNMDWNTVVHGKKSRPDSRAPFKRQRRSTGGASNPSYTEFETSAINNINNIPVSTFKTYSTDEKLDTIFTFLQTMSVANERIEKVEKSIHEMRSIQDKTINRINVLAYKSIDNEARQRRNNLIFYGISETVGENCLEVLCDFLGDKLGLDPDAICIQRAHRIGTRSYMRGGRGQGRGQESYASVLGKHRPIIAAFRDYQDVELILSNAKNLKGTNYGINRDYPQEIVTARKELLKEMKLLKERKPGSEISLRFPAKLIVDKRVYKDKFPEWREVMKLNRLDTAPTNMRNQARSIVASRDESPSTYSDPESESEPEPKIAPADDQINERHSDVGVHSTGTGSETNVNVNVQSVGSLFTSSASLQVLQAPSDKTGDPTDEKVSPFPTGATVNATVDSPPDRDKNV